MTDTRESLRAILRAEQARSAPLGTLEAERLASRAMNAAALAVADRVREWGGIGRLPNPKIQRAWEDCGREPWIFRSGLDRDEGRSSAHFFASTLLVEGVRDKRNLQLLPPDVCEAFNRWREAGEHYEEAQREFQVANAPTAKNTPLKPRP